MPTALVTGAGGFIGSNLVRALLDRGYDVRGLDNFETGREKNLAGLDHDDFELVRGDLRSEADVEAACDGVDYVFHQAAVPSVPRSVDDPKTTTDVNVVGTTNLLVAARDADVDKVVSASSSSVYGPGQRLPKEESMPVDPVSPYALSKYWTERLTVQFDQLYGLDGVALRYFNVFGPRQDPTSQYSAVIPKFIDAMSAGEQPVVFGDGEQSRDFTYIENVLQANIKAAESDAHGIAVNAACEGRTTLNELIAEINDVLGTDIDPVYDDPRPGDVRHSQADITKASEAFGYEPTVDFSEGLERTVEFMQDS